jgi:hypothetical protein
MRPVQVYVSYRPRADLCWLGEAAAMSTHADHLRWRVEKRNGVDARRRLAGFTASPRRPAPGERSPSPGR